MGQPKAATIAYTGAVTDGIWLGIANATAITARSRVYEFAIGPAAIAPVDQGQRVDVIRCGTALPTGGSTPVIGYNDAADGAALATPYAAATGGATLATTSPLYSIGLHQKASFRWVASPGREFVNGIAQYLGIGIYIKAAATSYQSAAFNTLGTFCWEE